MLLCKNAMNHRSSLTWLVGLDSKPARSRRTAADRPRRCIHVHVVRGAPIKSRRLAGARCGWSVACGFLPVARSHPPASPGTLARPVAATCCRAWCAISGWLPNPTVHVRRRPNAVSFCAAFSGRPSFPSDCWSRYRTCRGVSVTSNIVILTLNIHNEAEICRGVSNFCKENRLNPRTWSTCILRD